MNHVARLAPPVDAETGEKAAELCILWLAVARFRPPHTIPEILTTLLRESEACHAEFLVSVALGKGERDFSPVDRGTLTRMAELKNRRADMHMRGTEALFQHVAGALVQARLKNDLVALASRLLTDQARMHFVIAFMEDVAAEMVASSPLMQADTQMPPVVAECHQELMRTVLSACEQRGAPTLLGIGRFAETQSMYDLWLAQ